MAAPDKLTLEMRLTADEYGALLACVTTAAERLTNPQRQEFLHDLADAIRDGQRAILAPMGMSDGMEMVRAIQASERSVSIWLED